MEGWAVRPDRSLSRTLAASQIASLSCSGSQDKGDEMIVVKYRGTPEGSTDTVGGRGFPLLGAVLKVALALRRSWSV